MRMKLMLVVACAGLLAQACEDDPACVIWTRTDEIRAGVYDAALPEAVRANFPKLKALRGRGETVKVDAAGTIYRKVKCRTPVEGAPPGVCWAAIWETVPSDGKEWVETLASDFFNPDYGAFYSLIK